MSKGVTKSSEARLELAVAFNKGVRAAVNALGDSMENPLIRVLLQPGKERAK